MGESRKKFTVEFDFQDGSGWVDVSQYTRLREFRRERHVYNNLQPTVDSCSFKIKYNTQLINRLLINEKDILARVYKEDFYEKTNDEDENYSESIVKPYFTGFVLKDYKIQSSTRVDWVELNLVDMNYKLDKVIQEDLFGTRIKLMDSDDVDNSLIHIILESAGFTEDQIQENTLTINEDVLQIEFFKHLRTNPNSQNPAVSVLPFGGTYQDVLTNLLFQYGFTYYFDEGGVFRIFDFKVADIMLNAGKGPINLPLDPASDENLLLSPSEPITSFPEINNSNMIGKLIFEKKPPRYEAAEITWNRVVRVDDFIIFDDSTGADNEQYPNANIEIDPGGYYPSEASATNIQEAYYSFTHEGSTEEDLLAVVGATLLDDYESTFQNIIGETCAKWKDGISEPKTVTEPVYGWKKIEDKTKCKGLIASIGSVIINWINSNKYIKEEAVGTCCRNKVFGVCVDVGVKWRTRIYAYMPTGTTSRVVQPECLEYQDDIEYVDGDNEEVIQKHFSTNPLSFNIRIHNTDTKPVRITKMQIRADEVYLKGPMEIERVEKFGSTNKLFQYKAPYINNEEYANLLAESISDYYYFSTFKYKVRCSEEFEPGDWVILTDNNFSSIDGQPLSNKFCLVKSRKDLEWEEVHDYELEEFVAENLTKSVTYEYVKGGVKAYDRAQIEVYVKYEYIGGGSIGSFGSATYINHSIDWYGSGVVNISGAAESGFLVKNYEYVCNGGIEIYGSSPAVEGENHFTYPSYGRIKTSGQAYYYEYNKYIIMQGGVSTSGSSISEEFNQYVWSASGGEKLSSSADSEQFHQYEYIGSEGITLSGEARTAISKFVSVWRTTTTNESITIPMSPYWINRRDNGTVYGVYANQDFTVDWGDGTVESFVGPLLGVSHTYAYADDYEVVITGELEGFGFNGREIYAEKLIEIKQWGGGVLIHGQGRQFSRCVNLTITAEDAPDLSECQNASNMFFGCSSLTGGLSSWDVSSIRDFSNMFQLCPVFNGDISGWDTSSATNMQSMFRGTSTQWNTFNQDISLWDTSSVTNMSSMFTMCEFNQPIGGWDTSNVISMEYMFFGFFTQQHPFNQDISLWDTSSVTNMRGMFSYCDFNRAITNWNTSKVINMSEIFSNCPYNHPLNWDTSRVTNFSNMFYKSSFDQDLTFIDISSLDTTYTWGMLDNILSFSDISISNYSNFLIHLATFDKIRVTLSAYGVRYNSTASGSRDRLRNILGWSIKDGGLL